MRAVVVEMEQRMPELTIIVPTYNRGMTLLRCLEALDGQTASKERFEVIVSDDGSEDKTAEIVETFIKTHDLDLRLPPPAEQRAERSAQPGDRVKPGRFAALHQR